MGTSGHQAPKRTKQLIKITVKVVLSNTHTHTYTLCPFKENLNNRIWSH